MLRFVYRWLVRLHPRRFRERFAEEMLSIFDCFGEGPAAVEFVADGFISLVRQWTLRSEYWKEEQVGGVPARVDGMPTFYIFERFKPRTSALIDGGIVTLVLFCAVSLALRFNWTHPVFLPFSGIRFSTGSHAEPSAKPVVSSPSEAVPVHSQRQLDSDSSKSRAPKAVGSSPRQPVLSQVQTPKLPSGGSRVVAARGLPASASSQRSPEREQDTSPHSVRFTTVADDVSLEVLGLGWTGTTSGLTGRLGKHRPRI